MRWFVFGLICGACGLLIGSVASVQAHDDAAWIMNNPTTSWCCGPEDCAPLAREDIAITPEGVLVKATKEVVPYSDLKPSIDSRWWRCRRPGGKTRCLFRPPFGS